MLHRVAAFSETVLPLLLLWLLSVAFALGSSDTLDSLGYVSAGCSPKDPLFASGSTMILNCTLRNAPPGVSAHQVQCKFDSSNLTIIVLSNDTVQIRRENVTRQMSQGHVFCYLNVLGIPESEPFAQVSIRVADKPVAPNITGCVVYNWEKMVCTWEPPKLDTGLPTNYTLGWSVLETGALSLCPHVSGNTCVWTTHGIDGLKMDMKYRMVVIAQNELKSVSSPYFYIDTTIIVKPNPVRRISLSDITSHSANLDWTWGDETISKQLLFRVNYTSKWHNETMETTVNSTSLVNLVPHTLYIVSVECSPYSAKGRTGFWSDRTVIQLHTAEDVPGLAPAISDGSYSAWSTASGRYVEVFWQPVPERWIHGIIKHYLIRCFNYWDRSHIVAEQLEQGTRSELLVPAGLDLGVTVEAKTTKGYNDSLQLETLTILRADLAPVKPDIFHAVRNQSEITAVWSPVSNASGYTVYWCKKAGHGRCEKSLNWETVSANVTNLTIFVGSIRHYEFLVALSVETYLSALKHIVSSGMMWAKCVPDVAKHVKPPEQLAFAKDQQAFSLTIEWSKPKCEETAYIANFEILYCQRRSCDEDVCCFDNKTMVVGNNETKTVIKGLAADDEYEVSMRSLSFAENSSYTPSIRRVVIRSGLTGGVIAAIVIAALVLLLLLVVGLVTIAKKIKKYFYCCQKITIVSPPAVVRMPVNLSERRESNQVVQFYRDRFDTMTQIEEQKSLLSDGEAAKQDADAGVATIVIRENGENHHHSNKAELFQPLVSGDNVCLTGRDEVADSGVPKSHDSSISSYTHLAVPDESAHNEPSDFVKIGHVSARPSDHESHELPFIAANCPPSQNLHVVEPPVSKNALTNMTELYMPVEKIPLPVGSSSSSAITPYTTVEQTVENAELKHFPETRGCLTADTNADAVRQAENPADNCHNTIPDDYQQVQCSIDDYIGGLVAGDSNVAVGPPICTLNKADLTAEDKPLYANHRTHEGTDGYRGFAGSSS